MVSRCDTQSNNAFWAWVTFDRHIHDVIDCGS
jgi:hypothetical protein